MGADLYITQLREPLVKKYGPLFRAAVRKRDSLPAYSPAWESRQRKVTHYFDLLYSSGYFRDSYNITNVLATLGLSWWVDVTPLLDGKRELTGTNLKLFRDRVAGAKQRLPTRAKLRKGGVRVAVSGEDSLEEWHKHYVEGRTRLVAFLDQAIKLNTAIHCSL